MNNYYITFGQRYRHEPHPCGVRFHPDGYMKIVAKSLGVAREAAFNRLGTAWAFFYTEDEFIVKDLLRLYPRGCIETLEVTL